MPVLYSFTRLLINLYALYVSGEDELYYMEISVTAFREGNGNDLCHLANPTEASSKATFMCYNPMEGRYVHITSPFVKSLKLCEVKVNGKKMILTSKKKCLEASFFIFPFFFCSFVKFFVTPSFELPR